MHLLATSRSTDCGRCVFREQIRCTTKGVLIKQACWLKIDIDRCGPFKETTFGCKRYFLIMTTSPNKYVCAEPIKHKSGPYNLPFNNIAWLNCIADTTVKHVHCANSKQCLALWPASKRLGNSITTASPYSSQSNSSSEPINRALTDKLRLFLKDRKLDERSWREAL